MANFCAKVFLQQSRSWCFFALLVPLLMNLSSHSDKSITVPFIFRLLSECKCFYVFTHSKTKDGNKENKNTQTHHTFTHNRKWIEKTWCVSGGVYIYSIYRFTAYNQKIIYAIIIWVNVYRASMCSMWIALILNIRDSKHRNTSTQQNVEIKFSPLVRKFINEMSICVFDGSKTVSGSPKIWWLNRREWTNGTPIPTTTNTLIPYWYRPIDTSTHTLEHVSNAWWNFSTILENFLKHHIRSLFVNVVDLIFYSLWYSACAYICISWWNCAKPSTPNIFNFCLKPLFQPSKEDTSNWCKTKLLQLMWGQKQTAQIRPDRSMYLWSKFCWLKNKNHMYTHTYTPIHTIDRKRASERACEIGEMINKNERVTVFHYEYHYVIIMALVSENFIIIPKKSIRTKWMCNLNRNSSRFTIRIKWNWPFLSVCMQPQHCQT